MVFFKKPFFGFKITTLPTHHRPQVLFICFDNSTLLITCIDPFIPSGDFHWFSRLNSRRSIWWLTQREAIAWTLRPFAMATKSQSRFQICLELFQNVFFIAQINHVIQWVLFCLIQFAFNYRNIRKNLWEQLCMLGIFRAAIKMISRRNYVFCTFYCTIYRLVMYYR